MLTLLIDARDNLSSTAPTLSVFVQPSTLFISPLSLSSQALTSSFTPKMDCVRNVSPSAGVMIFTSPLIF